MKTVYLDTNIFIDILTNRELSSISIKEIKPFLEDSLVFMSTLSVHTAYYILKIKPNTKTDSKVKDLIRIINLVALDEVIVSNALKSFGRDFEDTLQYHSALLEDCDFILTRDSKDFNKIKEAIPSDIEIIDSLEDVE